MLREREGEGEQNFLQLNTSVIRLPYYINLFIIIQPCILL